MIPKKSFIFEVNFLLEDFLVKKNLEKKMKQRFYVLLLKAHWKIRLRIALVGVTVMALKRTI